IVADDGVVFQEKKSSLSYKLRKEMKKEKKEKQREIKEKKSKKDKNKNGDSTVSDLAELGIRIVNGREAEAIAHQPGDSDYEEEEERGPPGKHKFRSKNRTSGASLDPWKKILQS
ncbi:unnamed protein product, partial [Meganyctiphanes norvegica]